MLRISDSPTHPHPSTMTRKPSHRCLASLTLPPAPTCPLPNFNEAFSHYFRVPSRENSIRLCRLFESSRATASCHSLSTATQSNSAHTFGTHALSGSSNLTGATTSCLSLSPCGDRNSDKSSFLIELRSTGPRTSTHSLTKHCSCHPIPSTKKIRRDPL